MRIGVKSNTDLVQAAFRALLAVDQHHRVAHVDFRLAQLQHRLD